VIRKFKIKSLRLAQSHDENCRPDQTYLYAAGVPTIYTAKDGVLSSNASKR